jgi:hypothetical protein
MTADLSDFIPELKPEKYILIKDGCGYQDMLSIALQNRKTHPDEPIEWHLCKDNTYALFRVTKS